MEYGRFQAGEQHGRGRGFDFEKRKVPRICINGTIQYAGSGAGARIEIALFRKARPDPDLGEGQGRCEVDSL